MGIPFLQDQSQLMYSKASGCLGCGHTASVQRQSTDVYWQKIIIVTQKKNLKYQEKLRDLNPPLGMSNLEIKLCYLNIE